MEPIVAEIVRDFKDVHAKFRDEVRGRSREELNWTPAPETNSVAVLVVHTLGSEMEMIRISADVPHPRDRDAEFRTDDADADALLALLDQADALLDELGPTISAEDLAAPRPRRDNPPQPCLHWLVTNYGHAREHLAHVQLTQQLYAGWQG
jgi:hypothetical protein